VKGMGTVNHHDEKSFETKMLKSNFKHFRKLLKGNSKEYFFFLRSITISKQSQLPSGCLTPNFEHFGPQRESTAFH